MFGLVEFGIILNILSIWIDTLQMLTQYLKLLAAEWHNNDCGLV